MSVGESLRIIRELRELTQNQLAQFTGIPQATISGIENDRVRLGVERAEILSRALTCHPGTLVFPGCGRQPPQVSRQLQVYMNPSTLAESRQRTGVRQSVAWRAAPARSAEHILPVASAVA